MLPNVGVLPAISGRMASNEDGSSPLQPTATFQGFGEDGCVSIPRICILHAVLEDKFQAHLDQPRLTDTADETEVAVVHSPVGVEKLRVIEGIEQLHPEFGVLRLRDPELLLHADVEVVPTRSADRCPCGVSEEANLLVMEATPVGEQKTGTQIRALQNGLPVRLGTVMNTGKPFENVAIVVTTQLPIR